MPAYFPQLGVYIEVPAPLVDSARFLRIHSSAAKDAMRSTLRLHQIKRLQEHFKQTNRHRYNHQPRRDKYKAAKRRKYHSITDLVKTGETRRRMLNEKHTIRVGGTAESELRATMTMHFPFPEDSAGRNPHGGVGIAQMRKELAAWTDEEVADAALDYQRFYWEQIDKALASAPKWRRTLGAQVAAARAALR